MRLVLTTLLLCAVAQAATSNATLSINATVAISSTAFTATGTTTLTGALVASGTFSATIPLSSLTSSTVSAPFTITTSAGTLGGTLLIPLSVLAGTATSGTGSGTITIATGSYAGDTGSFPSLAGSGSVSATGAVTITISGTGTITTGGTVTAPPPAITGVYDDASNTSTVAQGSLYIVKGTNLSASGYNSLAPPYPMSAGGTSIAFTPAAGGTATPTYLFYTYDENGVNQLGGIIPSSLAVGNYNVTVTYNGAVSAPFATQVVKSKPAVFTQDQTGGGLAVVQNIVSATQYDLNRLTTQVIGGYTVSPAKPGQTLIAWATGLGAVPYADNIVPPEAYNFANVQVLVNGTAITPLYAGASGFAGLDQINFTLPSNVAAGCTVSLQISVGGSISTATTLSIAPSASASACVLPGYTNAQLSALDQGGTITVGGFSISQIAESVQPYGAIKIDSANGGFTQVTGFELGSLPVTFSSVTTGACTVIQVSGTSSGQLTAGGTVTNLDAGAVTLTGPAGSNLTNTALMETGNTYSLSIGEEGITGLPGLPNGAIVAGNYTLSGAGGHDVGSFNASITLGSPLTVTGGLPANVVRSQGLTLNWTGGNSTDPVAIIGYAGTTSTTGSTTVTTATEFVCTSTAGTGTLTVPSSVLNQLPQVTATLTNGIGFLELTSGPPPTTFSPSLTAGGTVASTFSALIATGGLVTYQ